MGYTARVYKVMIASPSDVATERQVIRDVIYEWNSVDSEDRDIILMPVGWESHSSPAMGERPQAIINKQVLADCDLLIAVFWTRLGSPTGSSPSGTVEEIEEHLKAGKPGMIYFSSVPVVPESIDKKQYRLLLQFKESCRKRGLIETYESIAEFRAKLSRQLAQTVIRAFAPKKNGRLNGENGLVSRGELPSLSPPAKRLLLEAAQDEDGRVLRTRTRSGLAIQTHGVNLVEARNPREQARWEAALRQLCTYTLLEERTFRGEVFRVTDEGYRVAELVREQEHMLVPS